MICNTHNQKIEKSNLKYVVLLLFCLSFIIFFTSNVHALGIGPSRQYLSYDPDQKVDGEFIIINDRHESFKAVIYPQGELADIISFDKSIINVGSEDSQVVVKYKIKFKKENPKPGENKLEVVVRQLPNEDEGSEGTVISASIAVIAQIIIKVPYPGKYAEPKFFISGTEEQGKTATFTLMVYNYGTEDINEAYADIEIYTLLNERVQVLQTEKQNIKTKTENKFLVDWKPNLERGTYKATAVLHYDGKEASITNEFNVGNFVIDVGDVTVDKFTLGDVAKFDILLINNWNTPLKDVYVDVIVKDSAGTQMTEFKTRTIDLDAHGRGELEAYWYTEGVMPGIYTVKLDVYYADKVTTKEYDFEVNTNSITRLGGMVGHAVQEDDSEKSTQGVLIILVLVVVVLLILMNVFWFVYMAKRMNKSNKNSKEPPVNNYNNSKPLIEQEIK